jgi:hypothetical protein
MAEIWWPEEALEPSLSTGLKFKGLYLVYDYPGSM